MVWLPPILATLVLTTVLVIGGFDATIALPGATAIVVYTLAAFVWKRFRFTCPKCGARATQPSGKVTMTEISGHTHMRGSGLDRRAVRTGTGREHHPRTCRACGSDFVADIVRSF